MWLDLPQLGMTDSPGEQGDGWAGTEDGMGEGWGGAGLLFIKVELHGTGTKSPPQLYTASTLLFLGPWANYQGPCIITTLAMHPMYGRPGV